MLVKISTRKKMLLQAFIFQAQIIWFMLLDSTHSPTFIFTLMPMRKKLIYNEVSSVHLEDFIMNRFMCSNQGNYFIEMDFMCDTLNYLFNS